jgi:hypothetical protein
MLRVDIAWCRYRQTRQSSAPGELVEDCNMAVKTAGGCIVAIVAIASGHDELTHAYFMKAGEFFKALRMNAGNAKAWMCLWTLFTHKQSAPVRNRRITINRDGRLWTGWLAQAAAVAYTGINAQQFIVDDQRRNGTGIAAGGATCHVDFAVNAVVWIDFRQPGLLCGMP